MMVISFSRGDGDPYNKIGCAARGLGVYDRDAILLLPDHPKLRELVAFYEQVLFNGEPIRCLYVPNGDGLFDEDIFAHLPHLTSDLEPADRVLAYKPSQAGWAWQQALGLSSNLDDRSFSSKYAHKGILHQEGKAPQMGALIDRAPEIKVPLGIVCDSPGMLAASSHELKAQGVQNMLIKPLDQSGGRGIETSEWGKTPNLAPGSRVILCEHLEIDRDDQGRELSLCVAFHQGKVQGEPWLQLLKNYASRGALSPAPHYREQVLKQSEAFLRLMQPMGMMGAGGLDFIVSGGVPYLIDPNLGRMMTSQPALYFQAQHAPGVPFALFYLKSDLNLAAVWERLQRAGLAFDPVQKQGVFPFTYLQGEYCSTLLAFAEDMERADALSQQTRMLLNREG